ncbi:MAG: aspartate aminotransferase family protein [Gammaproteobacteria bacterium]|nr:aspartate aminotransferase family protein [Gammaproteobacteria bacterium]
MSSLMTNYSPYPVAFTRGEGVWLYDTDGNRYLDALSGIAVCGLGHAHPSISAAISDQSSRLIHTSNLYRIPLQEELADKLVARSGMDKVFFCNSGAEANEAAIKLARLHARKKNLVEPQIVVMEGSFHGRTMATLTATGNKKVQQGFEPLLPGFTRIPYNDPAALVQLAASQQEICAVMLEPVQGENGVVVPGQGYLEQIRALCDEHGWLMILDEVQTGMCRTGQWFAFQHEHCQPDVLTLAKALGNGVPIGACVAATPAADLMQPGSHGSTFGGNPLAARAALAVMEILETGHMDIRAKESGASLLQQFRNNLGGIKGVVDIRGKGLMLGIELDRDCGDLVNTALEKRVLINVTAGNVIRLLPPLIAEAGHLQEISDTVSEIVLDFLKSDAS